MNHIPSSATVSTNKLPHPAPARPNTSSPSTNSNAISPERNRQPQVSGNSSTATERTANISNKATTNTNTKEPHRSLASPYSPRVSPTRGEFQDFVNLQRTFPSTPNYEHDHTYLDSAPFSPFFRASPRVTPSRYPAPRISSLPSPQYSSSMNMASNDLDAVNVGPASGSSGPNTSISARPGSGVETILRASADFDGGIGQPHEGEGPAHPSVSAEGTHISPARESQRNAKLSVVSPPEDEGPRRGPPAMHMHPAVPGYDLPSGEFVYFFLLFSFFGME